jgi:predicted metal-binding membrane protein
MASAATIAAPARAGTRMHVGWRAPVLALQGATLLAWLAYATTLLASSAAGAAGAGRVWWCMPGMTLTSRAGSTLSATAAGVKMWTLMAAAMTLPATIPAAQHVATNSLRRRQWTAVAVFTLLYLAVWVAYGAAATFASSSLSGALHPAVLVAVLAVAALYELSAIKRSALNRCHRSAPLRAHGLAATASVARFAWINASGCLGACWAAMLIMLLIPAPAQLATALVLTAIMSHQKLTRRPQRARRGTALLYIAAAAGIATLLLVT